MDICYLSYHICRYLSRVSWKLQTVYLQNCKTVHLQNCKMVHPRPTRYYRGGFQISGSCDNKTLRRWHAQHFAQHFMKNCHVNRALLG